tara:strand:+ start:156 stop:323 length:168 start_codon:yes stop_codon:yes gene_type:complete
MRAKEHRKHSKTVRFSYQGARQIEMYRKEQDTDPCEPYTFSAAVRDLCRLALKDT